MSQIQIVLPEHVKNIISVLEEAGHEAFAVGGCVRDSIMGREPNDWDITTSADPYAVKALFPRTIDTGLQHGTVTIMMDKIGYEVTTYRVDGDYIDSRHPQQVTFTKSLEEDLKRRDFTINAMAYNDRRGLVDIFEGMQDLEKQVIRAVGNPMERFTEDALRIMRAVRFSAQFGFSIEEETLCSIQKLAPTLQKISAERIREELLKLLVSGHPDYVRVLYETGITAQIMPEFDRCMETAQHNPHHCYSVGEHILHSLSKVAPKKELRLSMLLHDIAKPDCISTDAKGVDHFYGHPKVSREYTRTIMQRLKFDNDTMYKVEKLVLWHDWTIGMILPLKEMEIRSKVSRIGVDAFPELFEVCEADLLAQSDYLREEKLEKLQQARELYDAIRKRGDALAIKDLAVSGSDLIAAGEKPGKILGAILQAMLEDVLRNPAHNEKTYLLSHLKEYRGKD